MEKGRECEQKYDSINGGAFRAKCQTPTPNCHLIAMAAQQYPQMPYRNHFYLFFIFTFRSACLRYTEVAELSAFIHIRSIQYFCRNFEIPPQSPQPRSELGCCDFTEKGTCTHVRNEFNNFDNTYRTVQYE